MALNKVQQLVSKTHELFFTPLEVVSTLTSWDENKSVG